MTGFGKSTTTYQSKQITVEIRALNSKSLDLNLRMPSVYKEIDSQIRKAISEKLGRGKVDVSVNIDNVEGDSGLTLNQELAEKYYSDLKSLNDKLGLETVDYMTLIMRMPDVFAGESQEELTDDEKSAIIKGVEEAADKLNDFRRKEGEDLEKEFSLRINEIRSLLNEVPKYEDERITIIRDRMKKALEEIDEGTYDDNRFEQEMIFYIEKLDVAEEKMRLSNHLDYFLETMKLEQSGKKLGFIGQEIGREINTLGSKSNHAEMQKLVIDMKDNLEKIKEQILNTL